MRSIKKKELIFPGFAVKFYAVKVYTIVQGKFNFCSQLTVCNLHGMKSYQKKTIIMWILNELIFVIDSGIIRRIFSVSDLEALLIRACLVKLLT